MKNETDLESVKAIARSRKESEVIVDPNFLKEITEVQSIEDSFSITQ